MRNLSNIMITCQLRNIKNVKIAYRSRRPKGSHGSIDMYISRSWRAHWSLYMYISWSWRAIRARLMNVWWIVLSFIAEWIILSVIIWKCSKIWHSNGVFVEWSCADSIIAIYNKQNLWKVLYFRLLIAIRIFINL